MSNDILVVSIINIGLVGITSVYVILTWKLLVTSQKQLLHAHRPILSVSLSAYRISDQDADERKVTFKFGITNRGPHIAVGIKGRLLAKVNEQSLVTVWSEIEGDSDLMFLFPPSGSSDKHLDILFLCSVPRVVIGTSKSHFDLECIIDYTSSIGTKHSTHFHSEFDLKIEKPQSMIAANFNRTEKLQFK